MSVTGEADGPAAEGRRGGRRPRVRAARGGGIRPRSSSASARGAGRHVEVSLMDAALAALLNQGSAGCRRARARSAAATATRASRRTRPTRPPTARSRSPAATTGCSRGCARRSGCPSWRPTSASRPTPRGWSTSTSSARRSRRCSAREPADHWVEGLRAAGVPAGPINDVAEAFALAEELGLEPVVEADGVPLARPPVGTLRRRPPRLDEHGEEIRAWLGEPGRRARHVGGSGVARLDERHHRRTSGAERRSAQAQPPTQPP